MPTRHADILANLRRRRDSTESVLTFLGDDGSPTALSWHDLAQEIDRCAAGLTAAGVRRGDLTLLVASDLRVLSRLFLGCVANGSVPAIFPTHGAGKGSTRVAWNRVAQLIERLEIPTCLVDDELSDAAAHALDGRNRLLASSEVNGLAGNTQPPAQPSEPCFMQLTSGSGGTPKAVVHTHERVQRYLDAKAEAMDIRADEVTVSWLPLYHDLGLVSGVLSPLILGVQSVLMSPFHWVRNPATLLRALTDYRGTLCFMPNFALAHMTRAIRDRDLDAIDLASVRSIYLGAELVQPTTLERFRARFEPLGLPPHAIQTGYGMAEMVEGVSITRRDSPLRIDRVDRAQLGNQRRAVPADSNQHAVVSCGVAMPDSEIRITDRNGSVLQDREVGEIRLRSSWMLDGYLAGDDDRIVDGWLRTGDLGYLADGELFVVGRQKDLIIVGGRNIAPEEIEVIADAVEGLRPGRCVAFGISDLASGTEKPILVCETKVEEGDRRTAIERELRQRCFEDLDIALGRVVLVEPGWVEKTSSGKLARPANRARYESEFAS